MRTVTLQVPEMHCDHCKTSIEGAVTSLQGVGGVVVSVPDTSVEVTYDDRTVDLGSIKSAVEEQGYAVFG